MGKVIAICNQKGGVGKTTTAINLGIGLVRKGNKVLLVDVDPQGNLATGLGIDFPDQLEYTLANIMKSVAENEIPEVNPVILHHNEGIEYIPSNLDLSVLESNLNTIMCRETILAQCIEDLKENYDYIILDCTPSLGILTVNVLTAADEVIVPVQAQYLSLKGLEQLLKTINQVQRRTNKALKIAGILLTMVDSRTVCARTIMDMLYGSYGNNICIYKSIIPKSVRVEESSLNGISIFAHDKDGKAAQAYEALTNEVISSEVAQ